MGMHRDGDTQPTRSCERTKANQPTKKTTNKQQNKKPRPTKTNKKKPSETTRLYEATIRQSNVERFPKVEIIIVYIFLILRPKIDGQAPILYS